MSFRFKVETPRWLERLLLFPLLTYHRIRLRQDVRLIPLTKRKFAIVDPPDYLWLTKLTQGGVGGVAMEGQTFSNLLVAELMSRMQEDGFFDDVSLSVSERKMVAGQAVVQFTLDTKIKR